MNSINKERNELAKQYLPLVKKMTRKLYAYTGMDYSEVESYAWEGLVNAMNSYDPARSNMTFTSYAGYAIRHAVLNGFQRNGRTLAISYYRYKQMTEKGEPLPTTVGIDNFYGASLTKLGYADDPELEDSWEMLRTRLTDNFPSEWTEMFFSLYGIFGRELKKGKDIAKELGVSGCLITKRTHKMIEFIKKDPELLDALRELL